MREGKVRKLAALFGLGVLVGLLVKKLRGEPAPQFSNHPTVKGGPAVDPLLSPRPVAEPAPVDPTVPDPDQSPGLVPAPDDPTVPTPAPERVTAQPELDLEPLVPAPEDPTVAADAGAALVADADAPAPPASAPAPAPAPAPAAGEQTWVEPVDGGCPDGYPVKAKVKSGIYHQPGGLAYERTNPDRCYPDAAAAEADGLRAAKR